MAGRLAGGGEHVRTSSILIAVILTAPSASLGESAHKGWHTYADTPNSRAQTAGVKVSMTGSTVDVREPDPDADCQFKGFISASVKDKVSVQRIYLLSPEKSGSLNSRDITFKVLQTNVTGVVEGRYGISFQTTKTAFREGDVFAVVLSVDDSTPLVFLRIVFEAFVPH